MHCYALLDKILSEAQLQASAGKGKDRHAVDGERFEDQQICEIGRRLSGHPAAGPLFQAVKKIYESGRVCGNAGVHELLGAINYIAAGIILLREQNGAAYAAAFDGKPKNEVAVVDGSLIGIVRENSTRCGKQAP